MKIQPYFWHIFISIWLTSGLSLMAQNRQVLDTLITTDSIKIRQDRLQDFIEQNKDNSKYHKFIYKYLVRNPRSKSGIETSKQFGERHRSIKKMEGKIIRNIYIKSQDPFGYSVMDTLQQPDRWIERTGNNFHVKTKEFVIRNYLLQKEGDAVDSLKIEESERLMRSQRFIRRVRIEMKPIETSADSVDMYVYSLDSWSITPGLSYSSNRAKFKLRDKNFMGLGHDFNNTYEENFDTNGNAFETNYRIYNIQRTFVSLDLWYNINEFDQYTKSIALNRNFYSPLARWAGGIQLTQRTYTDTIPNILEIPSQNFKSNYHDYWGAISLNILKKIPFFDSRTNKFILAARYYNLQYTESPSADLDPFNFFSNEKFYLVAAGLSQRSYVQDRFIKNYDIVEDIPIGSTFGITSGIQNKNSQNRFYIAGRAAIGNYFKLGYFGVNLEYGTFLNQGKSEQSVLSLKANYYTKLYSLGDWKFRSFLWTDLTVGNNRVDFYGDQLTLNENQPDGIPGYDSLDPAGTKKWVANFQMQSYSPYSILGFRISPFINSTIALINEDDKSLHKGKVFSKIGLGIMFTNDYLIFDNFLLSAAWYNDIPHSGNNIFKFNAIDNQEFQYIDYEFGKPKLIEYNSNIMN